MLARAVALLLALSVLHQVAITAPGSRMVLDGMVSAVAASGTVCGLELQPGQRIVVKLWAGKGLVEAARSSLRVSGAEGEALVDGRLVCRGIVYVDATVEPGSLETSGLALRLRSAEGALVAVDGQRLRAAGEIVVAGIKPPFSVDLSRGTAVALAAAVAVNPSHLPMIASEGVLLAAALAAPFAAAALLLARRRSVAQHPTPGGG